MVAEVISDANYDRDFVRIELLQPGSGATKGVEAICKKGHLPHLLGPLSSCSLLGHAPENYESFIYIPKSYSTRLIYICWTDQRKHHADHDLGKVLRECPKKATGHQEVDDIESIFKLGGQTACTRYAQAIVEGQFHQSRWSS